MSSRNYVYKVQNARAMDIAQVLMELYGQAQFDYSGTGRGTTQTRTTQGAGGGIGSGTTTTQGAGGALGASSQAPTPTRLVGTPMARGATGESGLRIVPDEINNMIIVQCTPSEWEEVRETLKELDVIPRQVLIEARIYEVDLNGGLSMGVSAYLQNRNATTPGLNQNERKLQTYFDAAAGGLVGSVGQLVGRTRELLVFLNAQENRGFTRVLSAPTILASDNQDARIQVGSEVPILTSIGFTGAQAQGGGSVFTNTISNKDTGVILAVTPRINAGGLVSLRISQEVSVAQPPANAAVPSPTIQKRSVTTNVTVQDGETIALGGIIQEQTIYSRIRLPLLGDIPYLGGLFGNTSLSKTRTELIVLLTPKVISDVGDAIDRTEDLKNELKGLRKILRQYGQPATSTKPTP
jgi:general secretion pathway protein D